MPEGREASLQQCLSATCYLRLHADHQSSCVLLGMLWAVAGRCRTQNSAALVDDQGSPDQRCKPDQLPGLRRRCLHDKQHSCLHSIVGPTDALQLPFWSKCFT